MEVAKNEDIAGVLESLAININEKEQKTTAAVLYEAARRLRESVPKTVVFSHEAWEDGERIITADGHPIGCTVSAKDANEIVRWIGTAWAELLRANAAHDTARKEAGL